MGIQPNQKQLLIPGKSKPSQAQPEYRTDMQAIETWAKNGGSQGAQGFQGAPGGGGGGGGGFEFIGLEFTPDSNAIETNATFLSGTIPNEQGEQNYPLFSNTSGSTMNYTVAASWVIFASAGESVCILPAFSMPAFTGGPVSLYFSMFAYSADGLQYASWQSTVATPASGSSFQFTAADMTDVGSFTSDLTMTAGTGFSGNGLVSAGYTVPYIGSISGQISVPTGTMFGSGGGGAAYASLTGPGETTTPGDLTQAGGFTVNDNSGTDGVLMETQGNIVLETTSGGGPGFGMIELTGSDSVDITTVSGVQIKVQAGTVTLSSGGSFGSGGSILLNSGGGNQVQITNNTGGPNDGSYTVDASGDMSFNVGSGAAFSVNVDAATHNALFIAEIGGGNLHPRIQICDDNSGRLGFFGATPVVQAGAPTTLADVITILTNLGLCS